MSADDTTKAKLDPAAAAELAPNLFELYKLGVEMADRISARRGIANSFFLSVNTGLAAVLGAGDLRWYVAVAGVAFCVTWWALLKSYRELNTAKFTVILEMERNLPVQLFGDEWEALKTSDRDSDGESSRRGKWISRLSGYRELGEVERIVPLVFGVIYSVELVRQVTA